MTVRTKIIKDIIKKIDNIPDEHLDKVLAYVEKISNLNENQQFILSFAGSWKDLDEELFDDLTVNLHQNRLKESNE